MGVEYRHWLLPEPGTPHPDAERFARLFALLREHRWIPSADSEATRHLSGIHLTRSLARLRRTPACSKHQIRSRVRVAHMPFEITREWLEVRGCKFMVGWQVDEELGSESGEVSWVKYPLTAWGDGVCSFELVVFSSPEGDALEERCPCEHDDGRYEWMAYSEYPEGAKFGIAVDCSKDFDRGAGEISIRPELQRTAEVALGVKLRSVGEYY
jgi:hypothetical protein